MVDFGVLLFFEHILLKTLLKGLQLRLSLCIFVVLKLSGGLWEKLTNFSTKLNFRKGRKVSAIPYDT